MKGLSESKQAVEILKTFAICGEYPTKATSLIEGNKRWVDDVLRQFMEQRLISRTGHGEYKSLRLLKKGLQSLESIHPRAVEQYYAMTDNYCFSGDPIHKLRSLKIAETMQLMRLAGVKVSIWEKPQLKQYVKATSWQPTMPAAENAPLQSKEAVETEAFAPSYFYSSRELKRSDEQGIYKTSFTRVIGMLITSTRWYGVFNLCTGITEWNTAGEYKSCGLMNLIADMNGWNNERSSVYGRRDSIIVARTPDVAIKMLEITDTTKKQKGKDEKFDASGKSRNYIKLDDVYTTTYFVLSDDSGARMLRILNEADFDERIRRIALPEDIQLDPATSSLIADGMDKNHKIYYLFFNSELRRLRGFKNSMAVNKIPMSNCVVLCYPWQEPIVRAYLGDEINIQTFEMEEIEKYLDIK